MTLLLRPPGRGNWRPVLLRVEGWHAPLPLEFAINQRVVLAGREFRIARVMP